MNALQIRTATKADAPAINDILNDYVVHSTASIGLLGSFGFSKIGTFPQVGRKFDRWLDVVFFELRL